MHNFAEGVSFGAYHVESARQTTAATINTNKLRTQIALRAPRIPNSLSYPFASFPDYPYTRPNPTRG